MPAPACGTGLGVVPPMEGDRELPRAPQAAWRPPGSRHVSGGLRLHEGTILPEGTGPSPAARDARPRSRRSPGDQGAEAEEVAIRALETRVPAFVTRVVTRRLRCGQKS